MSNRKLRIFDTKAINVSLDIEACGEVLVSLGACIFDIDTGDPTSDFYCVPDIQAQLDLGLRMDGDAFLWWLKQSDIARRSITDESEAKRPWFPPLDGDSDTKRQRLWRLRQELDRFSMWMGMVDHRFVWAYPTSFDLPVVARVYKAIGAPSPWNWKQTLDARTLWQVALTIDPAAGRVEAENPAEHNALADAKEQAKWIAGYLRVLRRAGKETFSPGPGPREED